MAIVAPLLLGVVVLLISYFNKTFQAHVTFGGSEAQQHSETPKN
jgi:hypothetical protein